MLKLLKFRSFTDTKTSFGEDVYTSLNISDAGYKSFCKNQYAGFYFSNSLQLYSLRSVHTYDDIGSMNKKINELYGNLAKNMLSFGQDVFGNQFMFGESSVYLFNIETAETEIIASSFGSFIDVILDDANYYSGESILVKWKLQNDIKLNERLCPKKPFMVGGDYDVANLYSIDSCINLEYNSSIAHQTHNLSDGTAIRFNIKNKF